MRLFLFILLIAPLAGQTQSSGSGYRLLLLKGNAERQSYYERWLTEERANVETFFGAPYKSTFDVVVYPSRAALDSAWQKEWGMPDFKSECWMVASGVATKLDFLDVAAWRRDACEHDPGDQTHIRELMRHELVHVYHGQLNPSPDFSEVTGIDWFVEGLATYASGQLNEDRLSMLRTAFTENKVPTTLDLFWTGKNRYGQSGSVVNYIDVQFGREKLISLLGLTNKADVLNALGVTEKDLIDDWKAWLIAN